MCLPFSLCETLGLFTHLEVLLSLKHQIMQNDYFLKHIKCTYKGPVRPTNEYVTERKRTKYTDFGYPVIKFTCSAAQDSSYRCVNGRKHTMTAQVWVM